MFDRLVNLICEVKGVYLELDELEKQKRVALITLNVDELGEIERKEEPLLLKMRGLDFERRELLSEVGMREEKLGAAVEKLPYPSKEQEQAVKEEYLKLKAAILELNETMEGNSVVAKDYEKCFEGFDVSSFRELAAEGKLDVIS